MQAVMNRKLMRLVMQYKVNTNMFINEFFNSADTPQYNEKDDESIQKLSDTRKVRLTLRHLNRLRSSNDVRKYENEQKAVDVAQQYGASGGDDESMAPA